MNYNIFGDKAPKAPTLGKGTECIKLLCSQASNFMFSPLIPMHFPVFWAHLRKTEFLYSMQTWKELCDKMAISWLKVAKTWANWRLSWKPYARISEGMTKGKSGRLVEWQRVMKTRGATHAAASCAWTARWAVRQNDPHRAIPGHAMKSARKHKNRQESSRKHPHTPAYGEWQPKSGVPLHMR